MASTRAIAAAELTWFFPIFHRYTYEYRDRANVDRGSSSLHPPAPVLRILRLRCPLLAVLAWSCLTYAETFEHTVLQQRTSQRYRPHICYPVVRYPFVQKNIQRFRVRSARFLAKAAASRWVPEGPSRFLPIWRDACHNECTNTELEERVVLGQYICQFARALQAQLVSV